MNRATTVIVPAWNEASVIGETLDTLLRDAAIGEFDVLVLANGCTDGTAAIARAHPRAASVRVVELALGSKTHALNTGLRLRRSDAVLMLDGDIRLTTRDARQLLKAVRGPGVDAAIARMDVDLAGCSLVVRAFYRVWRRHPYFDGGKFAAAYALSRSGIQRLGEFPDLTADDEFAATRMRRIATAPATSFTARAPRNASSLLAVRTRSRRGTRALTERNQRISRSNPSRLIQFARRLAAHPDTWAAVPVYLAVVVAARLRARRAARVRWERDASSRAQRHSAEGAA